ncbi:hypothetical protein HYFRA_00006543 [Hymenoscyphus fraxineus]|uniref:Polyketide synthase n=1 Tax=Hymenoscyphus fraxineus TaxID=746836 RepID=A0A9N9KNK3_9HELO|nr:hypothetical protein HYFRA_00006543 [Hymenoscyphus fraxineus]
MIHSGAGGIGQAAIQLSQHIGVEIFTATDSDNTKKLLMTEYGIPDDHIFYKQHFSFAEGIKRMTNDEGVDVIINSLSGDGLIATWECIKAYGRFVEIGKNDISRHNTSPIFQFSKNVTISAIDHAAIISQRLVVVGKILDKVFELFAGGKMRSRKWRVHSDQPKAEITGNNTGKMVTEVGDDDIVQVILKYNPSHIFSADAFYVISGDLGGLRWSIASWIVLRGARNLILLSKSGPTTREAKLLLAELDNQGVRIASPACDITDASTLKDRIKECKFTMPPILGCVQASMVIKDSLFSNMTRDDWIRSTARPPRYLTHGTSLVKFRVPKAQISLRFGIWSWAMA